MWNYTGSLFYVTTTGCHLLSAHVSYYWSQLSWLPTSMAE